MTHRRPKTLIALTAAAAVALSFGPVRRLFHPLLVHVQGRRTVDDRVRQFAAAGDRVRRQCAAAGVAYPPARVVLLGLKDERRLEVYAGPADGPPRRIAVDPILAASGGPGPKLAEGDYQVPEGVYAVDSLNPNSAFHAALRVAYPNAMDLDLAKAEGRRGLGGSIMIHGGAGSVGCVAMGDPVAEELFVLAAAAGIDHVTVVLAPLDLRHRPLPAELGTPRFAGRYAAVRAASARLGE